MSTPKIAVVTGGHSYEIAPFYQLFLSLPGVDAYIQHIDGFASSSKEVRDAYAAVVFYIMPGGAPLDQSPRFSGKPKTAFGQLGETSQGIVMLHHAILAWTRVYRGARVFCYQSGHDHQAYEDLRFRSVLANGIR